MSKKYQEVMKNHGKSFYWASYFFGEKQMLDVSLLYTFCRRVDDIADELSSEIAIVELRKLVDEMEGKAEPSFLIKDLLGLFNRGHVRIDCARKLIEGATFDIEGKEIRTEADLMVYCYKVAGVVGLMMCPILGVKKEEAMAFAIDLGIAMQLTNICRDVLEDAMNGRTYIPLEELEKVGLTRGDLQNINSNPKGLRALVERYLDLADYFYESAYDGLAHIPLRSRLVIIIAAKLYRGIGKKIERNRYKVLEGRTYLTKLQKITVTFSCLRDICSRRFWTAKSHDDSLHEAIKGEWEPA